MSDYIYGPVHYSDCELSIESIDELAFEQIHQEDKNEQTLIQNIQREHLEMNNKKIEEAIETIVNNELRCDICKSIPCAFVLKHTVVEEMVANLSKKWNITRSTGNNKIREFVFQYLENDVDIPKINGHIPDCVLSGVLDLIPDPISSFPPKKKEITFSEKQENNDKTTTVSYVDQNNIPICGKRNDGTRESNISGPNKNNSSKTEIVLDNTNTDKFTNKSKTKTP